jgi:hypothetical protein
MRSPYSLCPPLFFIFYEVRAVWLENNQLVPISFNFYFFSLHPFGLIFFSYLCYSFLPPPTLLPLRLFLLNIHTSLQYIDPDWICKLLARTDFCVVSYQSDHFRCSQLVCLKLVLKFSTIISSFSAFDLLKFSVTRFRYIYHFLIYAISNRQHGGRLRGVEENRSCA